MTSGTVGRVAVVGGGLAGLIAAIELAGSGHPVSLFEGAPVLGGRARTLDVDGYRLNQGPHALYSKGVFRACLASNDIPVSR